MKNTLTWYALFQLEDVANVPDMTRRFELEKYGTATVRLCKGDLYSLVFAGRYLPVRLNERNPFITQDGKYGAVVDESGRICLGIQL